MADRPAHRAVAGDDRLGAEQLQTLDGRERAGDRPHDDERRAAVEDDVAGEEHALLRQPRHDVVRRVRGADEVELDLAVVDVHVEPLVEAHEGRRHLELAPLDAREEPGRDVTGSPPSRRGTARGR